MDSPGTSPESEMCPFVLWKTFMVRNGARRGGVPALDFYQGLPGLQPPAPPGAAGLSTLLSLAVYHSCEPHKEVVLGQEILTHLGIRTFQNFSRHVFTQNNRDNDKSP